MIFKGTNGRPFQYELIFNMLPEMDELTGFIIPKDYSHTYLELLLGFDEIKGKSNIEVVEAEKMVLWFEKILRDPSDYSNLSIDYGRIVFEVIERNLSKMQLRVIYDTSKNRPGDGAYSLPLSMKFEDVFKRDEMVCEIDKEELKRITKGLRAEFEHANRVVFLCDQ